MRPSGSLVVDVAVPLGARGRVPLVVRGERFTRPPVPAFRVGSLRFRVDVYASGGGGSREESREYAED